MYLNNQFKLLSLKMLKLCALMFCFSFALAQSQNAYFDDLKIPQDSTQKKNLLKLLENGYFPTKYFDFDLRYLIKFNQYEGFRTGLGGITNTNFSEKFNLNVYTVYGFRDEAYKHSIGASLRLSEPTNTWFTISYTDDLQETGSSKFLTDVRFFQLFEPRLLNISLFHRHITKNMSLKHLIHPKLSSAIQFETSDIRPTYNYGFLANGTTFNNFDLSNAIFALQWQPLKEVNASAKPDDAKKGRFPVFTMQYTKSLKNVFNGDFNFSKLDFKAIHQFIHRNSSISEVTIVSGIANGDVPLTHLYHAYPNNLNAETVFQRFSVAGITSFETMFFNEFFSDKFTTIQYKYFFKPFNISQRYNPQLVLISRYAIGDMENPERHQNITFNSLKKGYTESGFEINKLLFGFGLSFTYRYGAYHLPKFEDNIALKFTFNLTL